MFKELIIHYFQNYTETRIKLAGVGKVNVFIGSSDQGKSVIVRLVNWVKDNRPLGVGFKNRKYKNKTTRGIIKLAEPSGTVERTRGKNKNYYRVNGTKLNAVGKKVPSEVTEVLNLNDINIQNQFDHFFLLQDSPGKVATKFNEFVGLSLIDSVAKEAEKTVRKYNRQAVLYEKETDALTNELKQYNSLQFVKPLLNKANDVDSNIIGIELDIDKVLSLAIDLQKLNYAKESIPDLPKIKSKIKQVEVLQKVTNKLYSEIYSVESLIDSYNELTAKLKTVDSLDVIKKLLAKTIVLKEAVKNYDREAIKVQEYSDSKEQLILLQKKNSHDLKQKKQEIDKIHSKLKYCPYCKRKWLLEKKI